MAAVGKASQPSESNPRPRARRAAARHCGTISKVGPCGGAHCCIFVLLVCTSYSIFLFMHIQWHELEYTGKGEGVLTVLHVLHHTSFWQKFAFFWRVTCDEPEPQSRIGTQKASDCPINWRACGSRGPEEEGLKCPVECHETCVYHDITRHFWILNVINKYETLVCQYKRTGLGISRDKSESHIKLSWDIPSVFA